MNCCKNCGIELFKNRKICELCGLCEDCHDHVMSLSLSQVEVGWVKSGGDKSMNIKNKNESTTNANLIASAPELLEGCKIILQGFKEGIFVRNIQNDDKDDWALKLIPFINALSKIELAIYKAEGNNEQGNDNG